MVKLVSEQLLIYTSKKGAVLSLIMTSPIHPLLALFLVSTNSFGKYLAAELFSIATNTSVTVVVVVLSQYYLDLFHCKPRYERSESKSKQYIYRPDI